MQGFYPLYVGAMLYDQSQQVGMAKLLLYDSFETGFGSIEVYDNTFIGKDAGGGPMGFVTVRDIDGTPSISATTIQFTNGTVTDQGSGVARVTIAGGGTSTAITVATEASDATCFPAFFTAGSGDLGPKTNAGLTYNSATNALTASTFVGALTGTASGNALTSHTHGNISNAGAIGSTENLPIITTTSGVLIASSFGTGANTFCQGNDSRLSDARTPTSHVHGNITNAGAIGSTSGLPIVTTTSGVLTTGTLTGTGTVLVAATSPTLVTPALGTPSSGVLTNCTGLPPSGQSTAGRTQTICGFVCDGGGTSLTTQTIAAEFTVPVAMTLTAWSASCDIGTFTVKFWKVATGTVLPTSANSINTSGVGIATGTAIRSTTLTDFSTTAFAAGDIVRCEITAVATATWIKVQLEGTKN